MLKSPAKPASSSDAVMVDTKVNNQKDPLLVIRSFHVDPHEMFSIHGYSAACTDSDHCEYLGVGLAM